MLISFVFDSQDLFVWLGIPMKTHPHTSALAFLSTDQNKSRFSLSPSYFPRHLSSSSSPIPSCIKANSGKQIILFTSIRIVLNVFLLTMKVSFSGYFKS